MQGPRGLLDDATAVVLSVIDADAASCDATTGHVGGSPSDDAVQTFNLGREGCASGASWCKTITLDKDDSKKIFGVVATGAAGLLAEGCTTAVIDQDPLEVSIQIRRADIPKCCGDGVLQPGEQCDTAQPPAVACGGDVGEPGCTGMEPNGACDCDCVAFEQLLSIDNPGGNPALTNAPMTKRDLALAFSGPSGQVAGALRAVFTDADTSHSTAPDINIRLLQSDLTPFPASGSLSTLAKQLRLPDCASPTAILGPPRTQETPSLAAITGDVVGVVYASAEVEAIRTDIAMSLQLGVGCADEAPFVVNAATDVSMVSPDVARGNDGAALIVWHASGAVRGRIWTADGSPTGSLTPLSQDLDIAQNAAGRPRVAGSGAGWLVAYESGGNVWLQPVSPTGELTPALQVNTVTDGVQDQPDVARLSDGRAAVVWHSGTGAIYVQRYSAMLEPRSGDQDAPLSAASPPGSRPAIAGTDDGGGAFAAAWATDQGTVWARFLYADQGFAYNSVDGQNGDFLASYPGMPGTRTAPAIAIGGAGRVAIGWQDDSTEHPGVYVRAFPLPE
jgi:hypothetical protein